MARRIGAARASFTQFSFAGGVVSVVGAALLSACGGDTIDVNALFAGLATDASVATLPDGGTCAAGQAVCGDACVNESTDSANCGGCGNHCGATEHCSLGQCVEGATGTCANGETSCKGVCVDTQTDNDNCGICGSGCALSQHCATGACVEDVFCGADGGTVCGTACVATANDPANCGGCGIKCTNGEMCTNGACAPTCANGQIACGGSDAGSASDASSSASDAAASGAVCVDPTSDVNNCGGCGNACTANGADNVATVACVSSACAVATCAANFGNCNDSYADGCETAIGTDPANCGGCGAAFTCAAGDVCVLGACVVPGGGTNDALDVTGTMTIDTTETRLVTGTAATNTVAVTSTTGIAVNATVLLVQMQGPTSGTTEPLAGEYEENTVSAVNVGSLTLSHPLMHTYNSTGTNQAQVVVVPQYTDVTIAATGILTAPTWNGVTGGILAFEATGTVTVNGQITMSGKGFRGTSHVTSCTGALGAKYECTVANTALRVGYQGESPSGVGAQKTAANLSGGGGGGDGRDCGNGAGGGYGAAGANGDAALPFDMPQSCGVDPTPGLGGAVFGAASLQTSILLGGAGGEGGADEDGSYPGAGGNGGGIVFLTAPTVTIGATGSIVANGAAGTAGSNAVKCTSGAAPTNGSYGEGGGGGGAGGAIRILTTTATLGSGLVTAIGGGGGLCGGSPAGTPPGMPAGGAGGSGRIGVSAKTFTGTTSTTPAYSAD